MRTCHSTHAHPCTMLPLFSPPLLQAALHVLTEEERADIIDGALAAAGEDTVLNRLKAR